MQSWVSGFAIHLRIGLSGVKGDAFLGALGVDQMEDHPVVKMEGDMEVVDADFECRADTGLPLDPMAGLRILRDS